MNRQRQSRDFQFLVDGWISTATRLLGLVGLGYETFVDKLKNPTALLVFGALATAKDVLQYRQIVKEGGLGQIDEDEAEDESEEDEPTPRKKRRQQG